MYIPEVLHGVLYPEAHINWFKKKKPPIRQIPGTKAKTWNKRGGRVYTHFSWECTLILNFSEILHANILVSTCSNNWWCSHLGQCGEWLCSDTRSQSQCLLWCHYPCQDSGRSWALSSWSQLRFLHPRRAWCECGHVNWVYGDAMAFVREKWRGDEWTDMAKNTQTYTWTREKKKGA